MSNRHFFSCKINYGFFRELRGTVRNIRIGGTINAPNQNAQSRYLNVGILAGLTTSSSVVESVITFGSLSVQRVNSRVGGMVGDNGGIIRSSQSETTIQGTGHLGGIVAYNRIMVQNSTNSGMILYTFVTTPRSIGGIVGINRSSVAGNRNTGRIEATNNPLNARAQLGSIIGNNHTTPFNTTNTNTGTTVANASSGNRGYVFAQHGGRVGRQQGINPDHGSSCVADGTLITLADGSQIAVEYLTGSEMLLVWDFRTGTFAAAPILFVDNDERDNKEVAKLSFANGNYVKIIDSHGFFSTNLNQYVRITTYNAYQFVNHYFLKHCIDSMTMQSVRLINTNLLVHYTASWNPITPNHFAFFANGMLSAPGLFVRLGFLNIFEVDAEKLAYCVESYSANVEEFGLLTFEQFSQLVPGLPQVFFYAFNGQYLNIAMGRGLITWTDLNELVENFGPMFV